MKEMKGDKLFVSPLGIPTKWRIVTSAASERGKFIGLNRYPRQVIGIGIRLPDMKVIGIDHVFHPRLNIVWSKPARWWKK